MSRRLRILRLTILCCAAMASPVLAQQTAQAPAKPPATAPAQAAPGAPKPAGQAQPLVSTLNAFDGSVTSNAAILPAGTGGAIRAFVTNPADLILDLNGYFAP